MNSTKIPISFHLGIMTAPDPDGGTRWYIGLGFFHFAFTVERAS